MIQQWLSVTEAASVLGISDTTVRRRAQRDDLECRMNSAGRLEILVETSQEDDNELAEALVNRTRRLPKAPQKANTLTNDLAIAADKTTGKKTKPKIKAASATLRHAINLEDEIQEEDAAYDVQPSGTQEQLNPFIKATANEQEEQEELSRYQRMAGASIMLAQKQADEAAEELAHARYELQQGKQQFRIVSGLAIFFAFCTFLAWFTSDSDKPQSASATTPKAAVVSTPSYTYSDSSIYDSSDVYGSYDAYGNLITDDPSSQEKILQELEQLREQVNLNEQMLNRMLQSDTISSTSTGSAG